MIISDDREGRVLEIAFGYTEEEDKVRLENDSGRCKED